MTIQDLFVGSVSVILGLCAAAAALYDWQWCYQLRVARWIDGRFGRPYVRVFYAALSVVLICFGSAIALGLSRK